MGDFVHLHNHSHYSLQDGACTIDGLVSAALKYEQHAVALTDHGVMYGISEFTKKAARAGVKPIVGMEAYIVMDGSRFDRGKQDTINGKRRFRKYNHLVLLAKNKKGYENLIKLSTIGFTEGFYYKPRIDIEVLRKHYEGIICTTACPAGPISSLLINDEYDKAKERAILFQEIFGDDFYLEIQDHGIDVEKPVLKGMPKLSKELGIKLVATNDVHYIEQEHSISHNILLLLGDKTGTADYTQLRYGTDQVYFKSTEEMKELFTKYDGAIENTLEIEDKINFNLEFEKFHYPKFPIPKDSKAKTIDEYFEILAREGLEKRLDKINEVAEERFKYEVGVIKSMGYAGYFLITADFINAAKDQGIPVGPGRGSAAGSLVAYAMGITNVNPLEYDLLFERFLNPARKSMPDIDVDFADDQRGDVYEYTKNKYGEESVCQIITFNRLSSKAVLRDVARVLKIPIPQVNNITKWIPSKFGRVYTIDQALNEVKELKWVKKSEDPTIQELIKHSRILEGMNRNSSKHAAGVVITPGSVSDFVPLAKANDGDLVTQYNMKELDSAGLLKMDFLGLRTLTIIRDTVNLVKKTRGKDIDIETIPVDDKKTYKLFSKANTTAVFQFESSPMKEYLKRLKPTSIKDLAAMNALYRPGPMEFIDDFIERKHGRKKTTYLHPLLEPILKETNGIIVYQEQVIRIANKIAGMSLAEADILRRAMGKKDLSAMAEQKKKFVEGAVNNNVPQKAAEEIFVVIDKFANYGFNKSHAVAYSIVAYQTAYLKAHFLPEFLAANLTNEFGNPDKVTMLLDDARKMKIRVLPPDVNKPSVYFNVENGKIIFGMVAIKNVGVNAVEQIEKVRKSIDKDFTGIYDFCSNVDNRIVNKRALEALVMAGAFDKTKGKRSQSFEVIEHALSFGSKVQLSNCNSADSLFGSDHEDFQITEPELPNIAPWSEELKLAKEREVLGVYLTDHPLRKFETEYRSFAQVHLGEPETFQDDLLVKACGVITDVKTKLDRSGKQMAFFKLDDFSGSCECLTFSKIYAEYGHYIQTEKSILVNGRLESSGDAIKLHVEEIIPLDDARNKLTKKIGLLVNDSEHTENTIVKLKSLLEESTGNIPVFIGVKSQDKLRQFYVDYKVNLENKTINKLTSILGDESVKFIST